MPTQEIAKIPHEERQILDESLESYPIRLSKLAKKLGVNVISSTLPVGISGELRPAADGYVIKVNRHDSPTRQRFTVAHELSHFMLHRDHIGSGISEDVLYRSQLSDAREAEANRLAAYILMPSNQVRKVVGGIAEMGDEKIRKMAEVFEVSEAAMRIRLEVLGLL